MNYNRIAQSSTIEVVKHFWRLEAADCKNEVDREKMMSLIGLQDPEELRQKVRDLEKDCTFAGGKYYDNPTLVWTTGTQKNPDGPCQVKNWVLAKINLGFLYTCGINPKMKYDLDSVKGNLSCFVKREYASKYNASKYKEFQLDRIPTGLTATAIGVAHREPGRDGEIELIDGAHRVVSMLHNNIEQSEAYIAELKN